MICKHELRFGSEMCKECWLYDECLKESSELEPFEKAWKEYVGSHLEPTEPYYFALHFWLKRAKRDAEAVEFGRKIAKVMLDIASSHVYFIVQQAFNDVEWTEVEERLKRIAQEGAR